MDVKIQYFDGCPNWQTAETRLREALDAVGLSDQGVSFEIVSTPEEAERLRFSGSPTVLVNGSDPFPAETSSFGLTCRVYRTEAGLEGSPSVAQLRQALAAP